MVKEKTIGVAFLGLGRMGETHLRNLTAKSWREKRPVKISEITA
jgi:hypothetical protein